MNLNSNQLHTKANPQLPDHCANLVENLKALVATERKITAEIIEHIQKIDQRKIHVQMGYSSLFAFLTEYIGYSAASAQRRIEAARLLTSVPELKKEVQSGELNLSQVSLVAQSMRQKQKENPFLEFKPEDKKELLLQIKNKSFDASQKIVSEILDLELKTYDQKKVQKDESVRLEFTLSKEQMEMFNRVKSLMSHTNPNASLSEVIERMAKEYLKRKDPMFVKEERTISSKDNQAGAKATDKHTNATLRTSE
jgi:hypothetical protein